MVPQKAVRDDGIGDGGEEAKGLDTKGRGVHLTVKREKWWGLGGSFRNRSIRTDLIDCHQNIEACFTHPGL